MRDRDFELTAREMQVLQGVARGLSNAAIGRELFVSQATIKTHLLHIFEKLDVSDRTAAVTVAMTRGILSPGG
jgi:ATP/maltotriose-dependent transcriptional regulator MalT